MQLYYTCDDEGSEQIDGYTHDQILERFHEDTLIRCERDEEWFPACKHPDFRGAPLLPNTTGRPSKRQNVKVVEQYRDWTPVVQITPVVERLLRTLPQRYLAGIRTVVVSNASGLNRARRRSVTRSRKRKVKIVESRGLYHQAHGGDPAWIELFVDNIFAGEPRCSWRLPFWRDWIIGWTLCHEVGHHVHTVMAPEYREHEDVADDWASDLANQMFKDLHFWAWRLSRFVQPFMQIMRWFSSKRRSSNVGNGECD